MVHRELIRGRLRENEKKTALAHETHAVSHPSSRHARTLLHWRWILQMADASRREPRATQPGPLGAALSGSEDAGSNPTIRANAAVRRMAA